LEPETLQNQSMAQKTLVSNESLSQNIPLFEET